MCQFFTYVRQFRCPLVAALVYLALAPFASGQTASQRRLSISEAVQGAIAHSKSLKINAAEQGVALAKLEQARNSRLPGLSLNASYVRISNNVTPFSVSLPGVGDVVLNPQILDQSYNNLQVRQLIWSGGVVQKGIQAASREADAVRAETDQYRLAATDNAISLWSNLYLLNASERIIRENIGLLREQRRDLTNREKQGLVLKNDGLKLDLAVSNLEASLIDIRAGRAISNGNLALALAEAPDTEYVIDSTITVFSAEAALLNDYLADALRNRAELKAFGLRREAALIGQQIVAAGRMPTLSLGGSYDYNRPNQRVFPLQPEFKGTWNVGVFLSFDLAKLYTNQTKETEARYGLERLSAAIDQTRDGIQMEVNTSYQSYRQARAKIIVANKAIEQATENFRVEQNRLRAATTTPTDFLEANTQLLQARLTLETARANAELAHWKLLKSTGQLPQ